MAVLLPHVRDEESHPDEKIWTVSSAEDAEETQRGHCRFYREPCIVQLHVARNVDTFSWNLLCDTSASKNPQVFGRGLGPRRVPCGKMNPLDF